MENLLDELYELTLIEWNKTLKEKQSKRYIELVDIFHGNNIDIPFGITI